MITFSNVTKQFSKVKAVDQLSFAVQPGEIFALLGPNGAGKTTSVRMILQLLQPDAGTIRYGESLLKAGELLRTRIGYLPEERGVYQDTPILKTLVYLASLRGMDPVRGRAVARQWLERFALADRAADKVSTLSKGNQQKIQFIAAIMHKPDFAILDEAFSGFDPINQEVISDLIRELRNEGTTILLSAHQMQLVERIADRILLLSGGRELMSGTMDELRTRMGEGQKLEVTFTQLSHPELLSASTQLDARQDVTTGQWVVMPRPGVPLNQVLEVLTRAGSVDTLRTTQANLHDIFIQSFGVNNGGSDEA